MFIISITKASFFYMKSVMNIALFKLRKLFIWIYKYINLCLQYLWIYNVLLAINVCCISVTITSAIPYIHISINGVYNICKECNSRRERKSILTALE